MRFRSDNDNTVPWTEDDLHEFLVLLNLSVQDIRSQWPVADVGAVPSSNRLRDSRLEGSSKACAHLAGLLECSPARVKRLLASLWTTWGPSEGPKHADALYLQGAWNRTLPKLAVEKPDMFERINSTVQERLRQKREIELGARSSKATRKMLQHKQDLDPIVCRCGFSHELGSCVYCANKSCSTWQHILCYYGFDSTDYVPEIHVCDSCKKAKDGESVPDATSQTIPGNAEPGLCSNIFNFPISSEQYPELNGSLAIFNIYEEKEIKWVPDDDDILQTLQYLTRRIKDIARSFAKEGFRLRAESLPDHRIIAPDMGMFKVCLTCSRGPLPSKSSTERFLRGVIMAGAIGSTFYAKASEPSVDTLILGAYKKQLDAKCNPRILHNFHCEAVFHTLEDQGSGLTQVFELEGRTKARKLLEQLIPFLAFGESRAPLQFASDKIHTMSSGDGMGRNKALAEVISQLLRLKLHLTLAHCQYELYFPTGNCNGESRYLTPEAGTAHSPREIEYCVAPALLEYSAEVSFFPNSNGYDMVGSTNFRQKTESERGKSRVVFPAEVTFHV